MEPVCSALGTGGPFLATTLSHIDCQAQTLGSAGYQALAAPGSALSPLLTLALTIFVALLGYRLLIGNPPQGREVGFAAIKVGIVLLLATSWPAFHVLAYDVALRGPAELAQSIGGPAGVPGANGGLVTRLQYSDDAMAELLVRGPGQSSGLTGSSTGERWVPFDTLRSRATLDQARTVYLASSIAAFASVRLVAGLLLALGPLFALFLLFDGTRGLFEGWVRGLAGAALGATGTAIVLGVELALIEPLLADALSLRRAGAATPSISVELGVIAIVFALVLIAVLIASAKVAYSFRIPAKLVQIIDQSTSRGLRSRSVNSPVSSGNTAALDERSRALAVADAVAASQRRENAAASNASPARATLLSARLQQNETYQHSPDRHIDQRRTSRRVSASAQRRTRR